MSLSGLHARGAEKGPLAKELGARHYIDSTVEDAAAALQALGGASVILATATSGKAMSSLIGGLRARGRMVVVATSPDPIEVAPAQLLFGTPISRRGFPHYPATIAATPDAGRS
jgi:D-arabinose 1-dehydrogenase-like Zn-dependent alcohol dehydrogenase